MGGERAENPHCRAAADHTFGNLDLCLSRNEISDFTKVSKAWKRVPRFQIRLLSFYRASSLP